MLMDDQKSIPEEGMLFFYGRYVVSWLWRIPMAGIRSAPGSICSCRMWS